MKGRGFRGSAGVEEGCWAGSGQWPRSSRHPTPADEGGHKECLRRSTKAFVLRTARWGTVLVVDGPTLQYVTASVQLSSISKVIEVWKSYKSEWDFAAWLPTFFAEIKTFVGHEKAYYMEVFGQTQYPAKLTNLIVCILEALDPTFGSRITGMPLPELVKAYCATSLLYSYCCTDLLDQLPEDTTVSEGTIAQLKESLKTVIYHPYLPQQKQYDQLEKKLLPVSTVSHLCALSLFVPSLPGASRGRRLKASFKSGWHSPRCCL